MKVILAMFVLIFSTVVYGSSIGSPNGDLMFEAKVSPFPDNVMSGGNGAAPDPANIQGIVKYLSPYLVLKGDLGFLEISELLSVSRIDISEHVGKDTVITTSYSFNTKESRESVISRVQEAVVSAKSSAGVSSITSCVRGSFWSNGRSYEYEACYMLNHKGEWIQISYRHWPIGTQEP